MALKDSWVDKKDGDYILAEDINSVAHGVIDIEENLPETIEEKLNEAKESGEFDGKDGLDGERGLAYYRLKSNLVGSLENYPFADFLIPDDYVPKPYDLVLYNDGNLGYISSVDTNERTAAVAHIPDANLRGENGFSPTIEVSKKSGVATISITDKNGTQTVRIYDGAGGEGGGSADWGQNDPNAAGYVKNRTHWKEVNGVNIAVLPQTSVDFDTGAYLVHGFAENSFIEGNKYIVVWNGKEYEAYCYVEDGTYIIGNGVLADMTTKTDHPFCVVSFGGSACYVYKETDTAETITIKINGVQETIYHQLDPKYIPNMYYEEGSEEVEILPESAIQYDAADMGRVSGNSVIPLVVGEKYKVTIDEVDYICEAYAFETTELSGVALGAKIFDNSLTLDYPFIAITSAQEASAGTALLVACYGFYGKTIAITQAIEKIHHIPPKYIKDMYYEEETYGVIVPLTTAIDNGYAVMGELYVMGPPITLVVGKTYKVNYNGVDYECVAVAGSLQGESIIAMGDLAVLTTGTPSGDFPFVMATGAFVETAGASIAVIGLDGSASIDVAIYGDKTEIHVIPQKYIDGYAPFYVGERLVLTTANTLIGDTNLINFLIANKDAKKIRIRCNVTGVNGIVTFQKTDDPYRQMYISFVGYGAGVVTMACLRLENQGDLYGFAKDII